LRERLEKEEKIKCKHIIMSLSWAIEWVKKNICYQADEREIRRIATALHEEALSFETDPNYSPSSEEDSEVEEEGEKEVISIIRDKKGFYRIA
jgi:hypothetical protein